MGKACVLAEQSLRQPQTIDQAVSLINSLPKPLMLNCFLQNLAAPLQVVPVDSTSSVQPSDGPQSPRLFILNDRLIMSVVPSGIGKMNLEFSQLEPSGSSVKGELVFPIAGDIPLDAPYTRVRLSPNGGTGCRACHQNEYKVLYDYNGEAYGSDVIRPDSGKLVSVTNLKALATNCNALAEPYRCAILKAVFIDGQAVEGHFP